MWNSFRFDWIYSLYIYCHRWVYLQFCCTDFVGSLSAPYLILFGFARLTIGLNGPGPFCMDIFHSGRLPICIFVLLYCVSYLLFLGAGFLAGGGEGGPVNRFTGYLWVVSLSGATLVN